MTSQALYPADVASAPLHAVYASAMCCCVPQEINDNVEERINLQKALFELEDVNVCNKYELQNIEDSIKGATQAGLLLCVCT